MDYLQKEGPEKVTSEDRTEQQSLVICGVCVCVCVRVETGMTLTETWKFIY